MNPTNQKQQVIWYLLNYESITMKFVINDSMFFKMNTRLSEIECKHGTITNKDKVKFINRFDRKSNFLKYSKCVSDERLIELFELYGI
jgi:hypothetical protein